MARVSSGDSPGRTPHSDNDLGPVRRVMDGADIDRALARLAHEIIERNHGGERLVLLGIPTRGEHLARRLGSVLERIDGRSVPVGSLDVGPYRDDIDIRPRQGSAMGDVPSEVAGMTVVLVDDVLYTGRTIRAALDAVTDLGRPGGVQVATLVDRGHRELPIRADYVGKNLPTARDERVTVRLAETDGLDEVWIERVAGPGHG